MDLEMVLNELSLEPPAPTVQQAQQQMIDFLDTARMAIKLGVKNVIRTSDDLSCLPLAPDYLLVNWRNDDRVDRDMQFCAAVQKQLQSMRRNDLLLQPIFRKLVAFDTLCANWHDGSFLKHNTIPHISPESDATLQKYKNEHTFVCPDGISRLFSLHARFTPNAGRIYFYVDEEKKALTIGHIGHKLPNIQYPT